MKRKWWSSALYRGSVVAVLCLPVGALGTKLGLWGFTVGLPLVMLGTALALVILLGSLVGLITAYRRGLAPDKPVLWLSGVVCLLVLVQVGTPLYQARGLPPIHNISTDRIQPPKFVVIPELRGEGSNPLTYDVAVLGPLQEQGYPDIQTLVTPEPPDVIFSKALAQLHAMGLDIVASDAASGRIEATAETFWFGFKDDLVVRIRPTGREGREIVREEREIERESRVDVRESRVDVRSVSRVGQSDLGANARRIRQFLKGLNVD